MDNEALVNMKPIPCYDGYLATPDGRVYSLKKRCLHEKIPYFNCKGYKTVKLYCNGTAHTQAVHRLIAMTFVGKQPHGDYEVRHIDGNKLNNNALNLAWGTKYENEADKKIHGTVARGSRQGLAKLKEEDIPAIMQMSKRGMSQTNIGKCFSVDQRTIGRIILGECWRHVPRSAAEAAFAKEGEKQ